MVGLVLIIYLFSCCSVLMSRNIIFLQALGESLGKGDNHKDMDIITKFLKVCAFKFQKEDIFIG